MDKRRKPLTPQEQLVLRQEVERLIESHPEWTLLEALKQNGKTLHLTQSRSRELGSITELTLPKIEAGASNPTIATVQGLLGPLDCAWRSCRVDRDAPDWLRNSACNAFILIRPKNESMRPNACSGFTSRRLSMP